MFSHSSEIIIFFSETFDRSCATVEEQRFGWESGKIYREVDPNSDSKYLREVEEVYCSKGTQLLSSKYRIIYGNYVSTIRVNLKKWIIMTEIYPVMFEIIMP